jgi:hypothetical protein
VVGLAFLQPWTLTVPLFADHKKWWALLFSSLEPWQCCCLQITKSLPRTTTKSIGQTNKVHTCVPVPEALRGSACHSHR